MEAWAYREPMDPNTVLRDVLRHLLIMSSEWGVQPLLIRQLIVKARKELLRVTRKARLSEMGVDWKTPHASCVRVVTNNSD